VLYLGSPQVEHLFKRGGILDENGIENDCAFTFAGGLLRSTKIWVTKI
jgi:hypothetical protein